MKLSHSQEDYLEVIYLIIKKDQVARAKQIADALRVKLSSVTNALKKLSTENLIHYTPYNYITLTPEGLAMAEKIFSKHKTVNQFLINVLGLSPESSENIACSFEHSIDLEFSLKLYHLTHFLFSEECNFSPDKFHHFCEQSEHDSEVLKNIKSDGTLCAESLSSVPLSTLNAGSTGVIVKINGGTNLKTRLRDLGFLRGEKIKVIKSAPMMDPIEYEIKGYHITLRRCQAEKVLVEAEDE